jgi:hypothetical protein
MAASPLGAGMGAGGGPAAARIDRLILLDREVDMMTPMMTQITFEGLIDEITGIRHGSVPWQPTGGQRRSEGTPDGTNLEDL